ncbi:MAG: outer membrane beta-barrel protein [candidate division Zixibacteria bacterium]|nr:outer membrane beta-barrel protein [candidate division Zixibacteria bacterium]
MKRVILAFLCLMFAAPTFALTGLSFGVKGGFVSNYEQPGLAVGDFSAEKMNLAGAQVKISTLPIINFIVSGNYAWKNNKYDFGGQTFELQMHDLYFDASAVYPIKFQFVSPYFGGGVGSHNLSFDYVKPLSLSLADNDITVPGSVSRLGYHLVGGINIGLPAFPFGISAEYRMNWIDTPGSVTKYNSFTFGLDFKLP